MISRFFIDRPIFAGVISVIITLTGAIFVWTLPIAQYPEITPPTISVSCFYPGASSTVVAETVASPIEQQITGVENALYMSSQCTNAGGYNLTVTFDVGTDLDMAQVLVQNRVNLALPSLPAEVKQTGVSVKKKSPSILLVVNLISPDNSFDQLYLSNYATTRLRDELARIQGVGDLGFLGQLDYSMRVWLDPNRMANLGLTASDVVNAMREQNVQVAAGALGRAPAPAGQSFQYTLTTLGRLTDPDEFRDIIVKVGEQGRLVRLRDVVTDEWSDSTGRKLGGIQLGAKNEDTSCSLDGKPSIGIALYQLPGSNALETAEAIRKRMEELKAFFPKGVDYKIAYDTTPFIEESVSEVFKSLRDAIILVAIVVLAFLQTWRASLIPLIAVPVAIIGTFAVMAGIGYSLNNLSLFGLVLAIGIVVDDAIVVVEAVEHKIEHGLRPREATIEAMNEVAGPIIAISLVLMCVFIPCIFITGITGQFFRQFAVTIAVSTFFSAVNSLTLSPALAAILLKPKSEQTDPLSVLLRWTLGWFFLAFNLGFGFASNVYANSVKWLLRLSFIVILVYAGLLYLTYFSMTKVPAGFIPNQDKGYLLIDIRLPDSASLERTQRLIAKLDLLIGGSQTNSSHDNTTSHDNTASQEPPEHADGDASTPSTSIPSTSIPSTSIPSTSIPSTSIPSTSIPGVAHTIGVSGQSIVQNAVGSNLASMFVILDDFHHRQGIQKSGLAIAMKLRAIINAEIPEAVVSVFGPPPVDGLGSAGGFKIMIRDVAASGLNNLQTAADEFASTGSSLPGMIGMFNGFRANTPQMFVDVDRTKCKALGISLQDVFLTLQLYLGGYYANDFNQFGRTWQVNLQADPQYRLTPEQVGLLKVRAPNGSAVPISTLAVVYESAGPSAVTRYNGVTAAAINGLSMPGVSSGDVVKSIDSFALENLPSGMDAQWTELTYLQIRAGNTALIVFAIAVLLVFLVLAAQYESVTLPLAVILVVPMCLLCATVGVFLARMDINIFVQIGFVVLVGLASKNAILIVEFAKEKQSHGMKSFEATIEACRLRLRPIMMTSFAFILGVVPLALATGAGAEMRRTLGVAVFSGMLGVTIFGIFLTPVFYYLIAKRQITPAPSTPSPEPTKPAETSTPSETSP